MICGLNDPMLKYKPRLGYPNGYLLGGVTDDVGEGEVNPIELTYGTLTRVVKVTHSQIENGSWSAVTGSNYLKENGINVEFSNSIVNQAKNCHNLYSAFENAPTDWMEWVRLNNENEENPAKYQMSKLPGVWERDIPLKLYVDTPMHLLFLGVVKAVFAYVGIWSGRCGRKAIFQEIAKTRLRQLDLLKLSWLTFQVETFDTWAGWVSEKYSSLTRVALWIYGPLMLIDDVPPFVPPSDRQPQDWLVDHYKKWLQVRGLSAAGDKQQLKETVLGFLALPVQDQPRILSPPYGKAEGVLTTIRTMVIMITTIMQPVVNGEPQKEILEVRIRLFLNALEDFERPLRKKKDDKMKRDAMKKDKEARKREKEKSKGKKHRNKKRKHRKKNRPPTISLPVWLEKYNFLSLLNIPDIVHEFGSPRNYFEGKYLGERFVQEVKNTKARCPPRRVLEVLIQKLHEGKAIESMACSQTETLRTMRSTESGIRKDPKRKAIVGNAKVYASSTDISMAFNSNNVLSMIESLDNGFGVLYYDNGSKRGKIHVRLVERFDHEHSELHGIRYWKWNLTNIDVSFECCTILDFVVLLPKPGLGEEFISGEYTMITKEWCPAMLDNLDLSNMGIGENQKMDNHLT